MRSFVGLTLLAWSVGLVAADTTTVVAPVATSGSCAAQDVLDACLSLEKPQLAACATDDWDCMCTQANNVLTCYNDCPSDSGAFGAQQVKISYCNAASAYGTAASTVAQSTSMAVQSSAAPLSTDPAETSSSSSPLSPSRSSSFSAAAPTSSSAKTETGAATGLFVELSAGSHARGVQDGRRVN
ncbi:hypothetical protein OIDMADRAFT_32948 [Oidiodendron maius Zn]|uniref:Extracellular membrane protein CFEM domain-containing protein n=1 Tax=Oidiodendron maius (strain Zn) TaxID=913774 RepID=A0A0C3D2X8_OIDMZ|nr:hypothetical protein OIDMADRAFT_32948 [Oidiodendron maius Zn]